MKTKHFLLFGVLFACTYFSIAQSNPGNIGPSSYEVQLVPPNPEVASLGKFGSIPVNKYNGTANITVPIHTIELDGLQIPLNLSYNTGGIRVNQEASWVGLGWNLSEGIAITREVNGFEDIRTSQENAFSSNHVGWIYTDNPFHPTGPNGPGIEDDDFNFELDPDELMALDVLFDGDLKQDLEPDLFSASLPSGSFKFYLPKIQDSETVLQAEVIGGRNFKVTFDIPTKNFTIIDPNGFVFIFNKKEFSTSISTQSQSGNYSDTNDLDALKNTVVSVTPDRQDMISSWKVSQIRSPYNDPNLSQGNAVLNFSYENIFSLSFPNFSENYTLRLQENQSTGNGPGAVMNGPTMVSTTITAFKSLCLSEISGSFGAVRFLKGEREDIYNKAAHEKWTNTIWNIQSQNPNGYATPKRLEQVNVVDLYNNLVKTATMQYGYFNNDEYENTNSSLVKERYLRLKLMSVEILDQKYEFTYHQPNALPPKDSKNIDFWGFGNDASNSYRIPSFNRFFLLPPNSSNGETVREQFFKRIGADRSSNINYGKIGNLTKITYPTGGSTEFEYEAHQVVLKNNFYTPIPLSNGDFGASGLSSSEQYNFCYQQLKLAEDPTYSLYDNSYIECDVTSESVTGFNEPFTVQSTTLCNGQLYNIEIKAQLQCTINCGQGINPMGPAVWLENTQTGATVPVFNFDGQFEGGNYNVQLSKRINQLPAGSYRLKATSWTNSSPPGSGVPNVVAIVNNPNATIWQSTSSDPPTMVYETFDVGGARLKKMINKDNDGNFISAKEFSYLHQIPDGNQGSSGKLMDNLVFWSQTGSLFEYTPERYTSEVSSNGATEPEKYYITNDNKLRTKNSAAGSHIGYSQVTERNVDSSGNDLGKTVCSYINRPNKYTVRNVGFSQVNLGCGGGCDGDQNPYNDNFDAYFHYDVGYGETYVLGGMVGSYDYINGSILEQTLFKVNGDPVQQTVNSYAEYTAGVPSFAEYPILFWSGAGSQFSPPKNPYTGISYSDYEYNKVSRIKKSINTSFFPNEDVVTTTDYFYENSNHYQLTKTETTDSSGDLLTSKAFYPQDAEVTNLPFVSELISANRTNSVIQSEVYNTDVNTSAETLVNWQRTSYTDTKSPVGIIMADSVLTKKGDAAVDFRQVYEKYDSKGNLLQYRKADNAPSSAVWGYNKDYVVLHAENVDYNTLSSAINTALQNAGTSPTYNTLDALLAASSDIHNNAMQQANWTKFNEKLRDILITNASNVMLTSYTYNPLTGVSSVTDPRGYTMYYQYDQENRLQFVKDALGQLISENQYNFKNQN